MIENMKIKSDKEIEEHTKLEALKNEYKILKKKGIPTKVIELVERLEKIEEILNL